MVDIRQSSRTLSGQSNPIAFTPRPTEEAETGLLAPWLLSENDLPWLHFLFRKKYDNRFDPIATEGWFRNIVLKTPMMFYPVRLRNSFLIGMLSTMPWLPAEFDCHIVAICADDGAGWESMRLLRSSIEWARSRKCRYWRMNSETEYDLEPMAKRLGANEISPRFNIEL